MYFGRDKPEWIMALRQIVDALGETYRLVAMLLQCAVLNLRAKRRLTNRSALSAPVGANLR